MLGTMLRDPALGLDPAATTAMPTGPRMTFRSGSTFRATIKLPADTIGTVSDRWEDGVVYVNMTLEDVPGFGWVSRAPRGELVRVPLPAGKNRDRPPPIPSDCPVLT